MTNMVNNPNDSAQTMRVYECNVQPLSAKEKEELKARIELAILQMSI